MDHILREARPGGDDLYRMAALAFKRHYVAVGRRRQNTLAGLNLPVAAVDDAHGGGDRAFHTRHQVDPLANARVLLEIARIHQVHAAGVGDIVVNQDHFAVLAQIHTAQKHAQQADLQRLHHVNAGIAHHADPGAAEKGDAARRVEHQTAVHAAPRRRHQRFGHLVRQPAGMPDIEHHLNIVARQLDIADKRLHYVVRTGEQLQLIAFHAGDALAILAELEQRARHVAVFGGENMAALPEIAQPFCGGGPHGARALRAALSQMKLAEREVSDNTHQGKDIDNQQPGHGGGDRAALHQYT